MDIMGPDGSLAGCLSERAPGTTATTDADGTGLGFIGLGFTGADGMAEAFTGAGVMPIAVGWPAVASVADTLAVASVADTAEAASADNWIHSCGKNKRLAVCASRFY